MIFLRFLQQHPDLVSLGMGIAMFSAMLIVWRALIDRNPVPGRLKTITDRRALLKDAAIKNLQQQAAKTRAHISLARQLNGWMKFQQMKGTDEVKRKLVRAGWRGRDALMVFLFLQLVLPILLFFVLALLLLVIMPVDALDRLQSVVVCLFFAILAGLLPNLIVKNQTQKRLDQLRKDLPDAFDLLVICAEAGLSLDSAMGRVSREIMPSAPDLGEELALTAVELSFLPERAAALRGLVDRVPLPGIAALVSTLVQTEKYGTPLAQSLRLLSAELREERMMRAEEKAARLPAVLTVPMILFILPPLFVVLIGPAIIKVLAVAHVANG